MPIVRIAWYARPTALGDPRYLVGPSLGAQYLAVPPNWEDTPEAWLETTRPQFRDEVLDITPVLGDILTIGPYAYRIDATGWTHVAAPEHALTTSLTAGRPLAYGISPLAPRGGRIPLPTIKRLLNALPNGFGIKACSRSCPICICRTFLMILEKENGMWPCTSGKPGLSKVLSCSNSTCLAPTAWRPNAL